MGVPPVPGYEQSSGRATDGKQEYDLRAIRNYTLWGTLLAGGAGVELPQNDLLCEEFRSRDQTWE